MKDLKHIKQIIEVCLLSASDPLTLEQISLCFDGEINKLTLEQIIFELGNDYKNKGVELLNLNGNYRFRTKIEFQPYLNKLYQTREARYSRSIMETLAIIAYRQPVTRGEIEEIRGVTVNSNAVTTLFDRGWIEVVGFKPVPGKPELLATTTQFLMDLGINSLEDLPPLPQIEETFKNDTEFIAAVHKEELLQNERN